MYKSGRRNFNRLFDSKIAFSDSRSLRRIVGIASASRPCSVRTHHARVAPATRKRELSDSPDLSVSAEIAQEWSATAQSQAWPELVTISWPKAEESQASQDY